MSLATSETVRDGSAQHKEPLWEIVNLSKAFPGVQALDQVSFKIYAGEVHALLGENGSGKSTLAKCLAGVHPPDSGEMIFQGKPVSFRHPTEARAFGVATIYQEFSLVPTLTVAENIYLGRFPHNALGVVDWGAVHKATLEVLESLSLRLDPDEIVKNLSVAEQQLVEIAKAISLESNLLIMDEPTAALGLVETQHLMDLIRRLTSRDKAIIYISHRLDEVFQIADRVTILKDGRHVATAPISELKMGDVVRFMIGFDIEQHYPKESHAQEETCLEVEDLTTEAGLKNVSFSIKAGEVLGLGGMLGSGRTEIARAIYGLDRIQSGRIRLFGHEAHFRSPNEAVRAGIGLIPENRKTDGCFFNFEAPKNITISRLKDLLKGPFLSLSKEIQVGEKYVRTMNLTPTALEKSVRYLSGGNQQKVIVARWLFSQARLLIMDEPTQGIDIGAKLEVYNVINQLTEAGIGILLISSDFPELLAMSDRVAVVRDGTILHVSAADEMSEYQLIGLASGVGVSDEIEQWVRLRKIASPILKVLRDRFHVAAQLAVLDRREMTLLYLDKVTPQAGEMLSDPGSQGCTAVGRVLLAFEPPERLQELAEKDSLPANSAASLVEAWEQWPAQAQIIREKGFVSQQGEQANGMICTAAPVRDGQGEVIAAIGVSAPAAGLTISLEELQKDVLKASEKVSSLLQNTRQE